MSFHSNWEANCQCEIYEVCRECVGDEEFERISKQNDETMRRVREEQDQCCGKGPYAD